MSALRSEVLLAKAAGPARAAAAALDQVRHDATRLVLSIKASPPIYEAAADALAEHLAQDFKVRTRAKLDEALEDLVEIASSDVPADLRVSQADSRLDRLDGELTEIGRETPDETRRVLGFTLATTYRLGQEEVSADVGRFRARKAGADAVADFGLQDQAVLQGMSSNGLFWIGEHYGDVVDGTGFRKKIARLMAEEGLGRKEAGRELGRLFDGQIDRSDSYWEGFAATVATRSRSFGALSEMEDLGVRTYEYSNPDDERTSDVCRHLNGTRFSVKLGAKLRDELLQIDDPEEWKARAPWPRNVDEIKDLSPAELQARGIAWPPLHFRCRSAIQVVLEDLFAADPEPETVDASPDEDGNRFPAPTAEEDPLVGAPSGFWDDIYGYGHGRPVSGMVTRSKLLEASDEARVMECVNAFDQVPKALQEAAVRSGAVVHVHRWLPDRHPHLKGRPRGWTRGSWKDVVGCGGRDATMAVRGTKGGWGLRHTTLHEWGHALDFVNRRDRSRSGSLSSDPRWRKLWKAAKRKPRGKERALTAWYKDAHGKWAGEPGYFLQKPPAGPEEFFAEMVAEVFNNPESRARAAKHFPELLDTLAELLTEGYGL